MSDKEDIPIQIWLNRDFIASQLRPCDVYDRLLQHDIITWSEREMVDSKVTSDSKTHCLVDIIIRKENDTCVLFVDALTDGHSHIVNKIQATSVTDRERSEYLFHVTSTSSPMVQGPVCAYAHSHIVRKIQATSITDKTRSEYLSYITSKSSRMGQCPISAPDIQTENTESPLLAMDVTPADDVDVLKLLNNTKDVYRMAGKPRGRAVIINNSYFVKSAPREGAAFDSINLCEHFKQLLFETVLHDDSTAEDIRDILEFERQHEAHYNADCFVLFILSHGANGFVYGIDGQRLSIERDIVTPFDGANCPALVDKPKLFFVQACQGDAVTEGIAATGTGDSEVDGSPIQESMPEVEQALRDLRIQDTDQTMPRLSHTHEKSDIVLAYSTVPGYRAWRRTDLGSWFVRAIVQIFSAEACKEDVLSLLVKVRQRVAENQTNHEDSSFVQLTRTDETTKKKIYFFPGYYETQRGDRV